MELPKPIDVAPKNGDFIILQDASSWELGRWDQEVNGWVQPDGAPVRISPTHWTRAADDVAGATDREHLLFLAGPLPDDETEQPRKRPLTRLILASVTAILCIGGFVFWIGSEGSSSDHPAADSRASVAIGSLTDARERENAAQALEAKQIADAKQKEMKQALDESEKRSEALTRELASVRENDVAARNLAAARERDVAQALEAKQIADAKQKELKQALDESEKGSEALARELASVRENDVAARNLAAAREREDAAQALEAKKITDARKELKQALDESERRAFALEGELASARKTIASAAKPSNAEVTARDAASPTGPLNRPIEGSNAASEITASITTPQSGGNITAAVQVSSDATPADATATAGASGQLTRSNRSQPGRPQPPSAMSSAEEATLIARAESLIRQYNFVGARLLLAHALDKGSANAAFMMAQTYDWRILRSLRAYGVRGDAAMAREFYQQAAAAGIEEAQQRVEALQPDANVDTRVEGEKRSRPESRQRGRFASPNGPF